MMNLLNFLNDFKQQENKQAIEEMLPQILRAIHVLFEQIKLCPRLEDAALYFELISDIQFVLDRAAFIKGIKISTELDHFLRDFERIDDPQVKEFIYNGLKDGSYSLHNKNHLWFDFE